MSWFFLHHSGPHDPAAGYDRALEEWISNLPAREEPIRRAIELAEPFDKAAFLHEVRTLRAGLPEGESVVEAMRQSDRY